MKLFWVHMLVKFKFIISLYHIDKTQLLLYFPIFFNISWEMKKNLPLLHTSNSV